MKMSSKIEQLAKEVGWNKFDLLRHVRSWCAGHNNVAIQHLQHQTLDLTLRLVSKTEKSEEGVEELLQHLIKKAPFKIYVDNLEDRDGCVMVSCNSKILAEHDQSIAGSMWECPGDLNIAYAMPLDSPTLLQELRDGGYEIDDSEYSPPGLEDGS